jgi:sugar phosphate isomerase/epimerase
MKNLGLTFVLSLVVLALACSPRSVASDETAGIGPSFKGPVGLQLYSLRDDFARDVPGTLDKVKSYGIKYVELAGTYDQSPADFRKQLEARGLEPVAGHFAYERYRDDLPALTGEIKALGLKYAGVAWIPHQGTFNEGHARDAASVFNRAGEALAKEGVKFFYHQHGYEFHPHAEGTLMDLIMKETNPEYVAFEMDIFWMVFPAQDPVQWLKKYPNRWELMHLKDMKKGVETGSLSGQAEVGFDVTLGTGQMDMPAILRAAQEAGVKYYFIEDESPAAATQIPESLRFLEHVRF